MDIEMYEKRVTLLPLAKNSLYSTLNAEKVVTKACYFSVTLLPHKYLIFNHLTLLVNYY